MVRRACGTQSLMWAVRRLVRASLIILFGLLASGEVAANQTVLTKPSIRANDTGALREYRVSAPRRVRRALSLLVSVDTNRKVLHSVRVVTDGYHFDLSNQLLEFISSPHPDGILLGSDMGVFGEEYWWIIPYGEEAPCRSGTNPRKARPTVEIHVAADGTFLEAKNGSACH